MENQEKSQITDKLKQTKKFLYWIIGLVILVIVVAGVVGIRKQGSVPVPGYPTPSTPLQEVKEEAPQINSEEDLRGALKQVDITDPESLGTELSQNDTDASKF